MKFQKYYDLIKEQSEIYDKTQNCQVGQTWKYHLLPVIQNACMLAEKYEADKDVVEMAAIFHDYADLLDFANREMSNVVLSLDGRKEVHDRFRVVARWVRARIY